MIADPETIRRIRAEADAYAAAKITSFPNIQMSAIDQALVLAMVAALRQAFLRGADVGYTAAIAEGRKP